MRIRTILEGNAFYEIDVDCMERKNEKKEPETKTGNTKKTLPENPDRKKEEYKTARFE